MTLSTAAKEANQQLHSRIVKDSALAKSTSITSYLEVEWFVQHGALDEQKEPQRKKCRTISFEDLFHHMPPAERAKALCHFGFDYISTSHLQLPAGFSFLSRHNLPSDTSDVIHADSKLCGRTQSPKDYFNQEKEMSVSVSSIAAA